MLLRKIKGIVYVFTVCFVFVLFAGRLVPDLNDENASAMGIEYIIDAGHGKPDGGAVAADGTEEQALNLAVAKAIAKRLEENKMGYILTRSDENSIFSEGDTIHEKKVSDIRERVKLAESNHEATMISIHMNSFPDSNVHGIQVFCRESDSDTKKLASDIQTALNQKIQPNNTKSVKTISPNIYLFSHIDNPSVLIECGFLSNPEELEKLKTEQYQEKLAEIIAEVLCAQG